MSTDLMTRRSWANINKSVIRSSAMTYGVGILDWAISESEDKPTIFWCDNLELPIYKAEANGRGCYAISTPNGYIRYSTDLETYKAYMDK